ncbi:hypothetical protein GCM10023096_34000 [Nonomuraea ferruginea]
MRIHWARFHRAGAHAFRAVPGSSGGLALPGAAGVDDLRSQVDLRLREFVERRLPSDGEPDFRPLRDAAEDLLAGGKRLRPAFCYWGWRAAGGGDEPDVFSADPPGGQPTVSGRSWVSPGPPGRPGPSGRYRALREVPGPPGGTGPSGWSRPSGGSGPFGRFWVLRAVLGSSGGLGLPWGSELLGRHRRSSGGSCGNPRLGYSGRARSCSWT